MKLSVLVDDIAADGFEAEHGLSIYVESAGRTFLFDTGTTDLFVKTADQMGLDINAAEFAVISHGHNDHGGGIDAFFAANTTAPVYLNEHAFEPHYTKRKTGEMQYNGLDPELQGNPRIKLVSGDLELDDSLTIFTDPKGHRLPSGSNSKLQVPDGDGFKQDPFTHEQSLLFQAEGKTVLFAGCSHRGIVNIMDKAVELAGKPMDLVIGGFHLSNPRDGGSEPRETIDAVAEYFMSFEGTQYWTCHCTGTVAFEMLREDMGERIKYASAGTVIVL